MNPVLHVEQILFLSVVAAFIALLTAERLWPHAPIDRKTLGRSFVTNTSAFAFNNVVMSILSVSSLFVVAERWSGHGLLSGLEPGPLKWVATFVLFDFAVFGWHWLGHRSEWLWRFHKIHHSDRNFHVTTGLRFHVFDMLLEVLFKCVCAILIGAEAQVVVVCEVLRMFFVLFHHANVALPGERALSFVIVTPMLHRAHHSTRRSEHDSNYGIVLSLWDMIFGTRKELVPRRIGLDLIQADNFVQLFSLAFVTERGLARILNFVPKKGRRPPGAV